MKFIHWRRRMKSSLIKFLVLGSYALLIQCNHNSIEQSSHQKKSIDSASKKFTINSFASKAFNAIHYQKSIAIKTKVTPVEYIQHSCTDILNKNPELNNTLKLIAKLPATSQNASILNDVTLIALNKNLLSHACYKIFAQDPLASKTGYDNFLKGLHSLNNVQHKKLRELSLEIAAEETEILRRKATDLNFTFKPGFEDDVFSLGRRLEQQEN